MRISAGLSFLDVLCSAMGGAVVLAVIFATIKNPVQLPISDEFIIVEVTASREGNADQNAPVPAPGLRIIPPESGGQSFDLRVGAIPAELGSVAKSIQIWEVALAPSPNEEGRRAVTYVVIEQPSGGKWELRPTMVRRMVSQRDTSADANKRAWISFFEGSIPDGDPTQDRLRIESVRVWTRDTSAALPKEGSGELDILVNPGESGSSVVLTLGAKGR